MSRPKVGGYRFNRQLAQGRAALQGVREAVGLINDLARNRSTQNIPIVLVEIMLQVSTVENALNQIEQIAQENESPATGE